MNLLQMEFLQNPVWRWLMTLVIAAVVYVVLVIIKSLIVKKLAPKAELTKSAVDDIAIAVLQKTHIVFLLILSLIIGSLFLAIPTMVSTLVRSIIIIAVALQAAIWGNELIKQLLVKKPKPGELVDSASASAYGILTFFARLVLWCGVLLWLLSNLGINITAMVTGLGIGGIAMALAVQSVLGDVLNSVTIVLDKPFEVGDFIIVDQYMGTVEQIGIKTTRVKSLQGEQIVFSNTDLINSRVQNFKRMDERRILFSFGVVYQTPAEKLEMIPGMVREILDNTEQARLDRVHFKSYGDFSLDYEVVYYVASREYNLYMDVQQAINLALYKRFEQEGIEFAYPTQTLFVQRE